MCQKPNVNVVRYFWFQPRIIQVQISSISIYKVIINDYPEELSRSFLANFSKNFKNIEKLKILSPCIYHFRKIPRFNLASQKSKVELVPPTENIYILDLRWPCKTEIRYFLWRKLNCIAFFTN